ncbi:MAG TPA: 50S ribosomal protein L3 [Candidatus Azoamicus sp. OHIO1]
MAIGLIGYKCGMTRFFDNNGLSIPVTVVKIYYNYIIGLKSVINDGYSAVQVSTGYLSKNKMSRSVLGIYKKTGVSDLKDISEFRVDNIEMNKYNLGDVVNISLLDLARFVDIIGISKGKGFSGVIKRHNFSAQYATHGNSLSHRAPGSIGQCQTPGRVFKGKKMPGHMGNVRVTIKNLEIAKIYKEDNVVLFKGAVPGAIGCKVLVKNIVN